VRPLPRLSLLWIRLGLASSLLLALSPGLGRAAGVPAHDRVVIVVMENKSYDVARSQPYTMSLMALGATFARSFGVAHPSQPNYLALFAGWDINVTNDNCPAPGSPYSLENLGHACEASGKTWRAYSENLPSPGATGCSYDGNVSTGLYTRKHDPWTYFNNVNHQNERPYSDLAADIAGGTLPNLVYVIPNNCHNSHNTSTPGCGTANGDQWLSTNLPPLIATLGPSGLLILTWDEDDSASGNHILTVFVGPKVITGAISNVSVSHYTMVRTICEAMGLPVMNQAVNANPITDVWQDPVPTQTKSWGSIKATYR
jgi:acid phosphatase